MICLEVIWKQSGNLSIDGDTRPLYKRRRATIPQRIATYL